MAGADHKAMAPWEARRAAIRATRPMDSPAMAVLAAQRPAAYHLAGRVRPIPVVARPTTSTDLPMLLDIAWPIRKDVTWILEILETESFGAKCFVFQSWRTEVETRSSF